jgi:hypothetical protein
MKSCIFFQSDLPWLQHTLHLCKSCVKHFSKAYKGTVVTFLIPFDVLKSSFQWYSLQGVDKSWLAWGQVNKVGSWSQCHNEINHKPVWNFTQIYVFQIFVMNLMSCLLVNVQLNLHKLYCQAMISGHQFTNLWNPFHISSRQELPMHVEQMMATHSLDGLPGPHVPLWIF